MQIPCRKDGADPDDWFIPQRSPDNTADDKRRRRRAKQECWSGGPNQGHCPIRLKCLDAGMAGENIFWGIWGGYDEKERQQIAAELAARGQRERDKDAEILAAAVE